MVRGRLNKAQRGELLWHLPVGLEYDALSGQIRLAVDQSIRHAIALVFDLFRKLRTVRGVLHYLAREHIELPSQAWVRGVGAVIQWHPPRYHVIYQIVTNPMYAGVYVYGRRQSTSDPITHTRHTCRTAQRDWEIWLPGHHPGYLSPEDYEAKVAMLKNTYNQFPANQGATREGPTLLQGLVWCQHCGRKMRVCYHASQPYYVCDAAHRTLGTTICNRASARRVDVLVEDLLLSVITPHTVERSREYDQQLHEQAAQIERTWQDKLQRLRYQADLARRRYEAVDPANRLVAQTLETDWNARLVEVEAAEQAYRTQRPTPPQLHSTLTQMHEVLSQLPQIWYQAGLTEQDKKELVRCVIERVTLNTQTTTKVIHVEIGWQGGAISTVEVPKYLFSAPQIFYRITELAHEHADAEIADILNTEGIRTVKGRVWSARRVMDFRLSNAIPSEFTVNPQLRRTEQGFITSMEAATRLEITQTTVQKWYKLGVLAGKHAGGQAHLWIHWTDEVAHRLGGQAPCEPVMVSLKRLCRLRQQTWDQVIAWCLAEGHQIFRLRRGTTFRFYVLPSPSSPPLL